MLALVTWRKLIGGLVSPRLRILQFPGVNGPYLMVVGLLSWKPWSYREVATRPPSTMSLGESLLRLTLLFWSFLGEVGLILWLVVLWFNRVLWVAFLLLIFSLRFLLCMVSGSSVFCLPFFVGFLHVVLVFFCSWLSTPCCVFCAWRFCFGRPSSL